MALRDAACLLVQLLGCMFRVDLLGANQKTDQLFMHFPCLICKKGASKWFSEAPCDNFQYLRSCNDFLVQTRQVRSDGLLLCIISRDHSKISCLFLTMEPETEFNPKQMQNPRDSGFEKNVLSWHIWFKPEFHCVPSCMFLVLLHRVQIILKVWDSYDHYPKKGALHTCITSCHKCIILHTAKRPPQIQRWNRQVPQDDFPGAICDQGHVKRRIQQPSGSGKTMVQRWSKMFKVQFKNTSLHVFPTVSVLKGNRFHLRGQFSKNGLQPDCRWRTQSSNCMDLMIYSTLSYTHAQDQQQQQQHRRHHHHHHQQQQQHQQHQQHQHWHLHHQHHQQTSKTSKTSTTSSSGSNSNSNSSNKKKNKKKKKNNNNNNINKNSNNSNNGHNSNRQNIKTHILYILKYMHIYILYYIIYTYIYICIKASKKQQPQHPQQRKQPKQTKLPELTKPEWHPPPWHPISCTHKCFFWTCMVIVAETSTLEFNMLRPALFWLSRNEGLYNLHKMQSGIAHHKKPHV